MQQCISSLLFYVVLCNISCFSFLFKQKCLVLNKIRNIETLVTTALVKLILIFWYIGLHTTGTCLSKILYHLYIIKLLICRLNIEFLVDKCFSFITLDISVHYLLISDEKSDVSHLIEDSLCTMCPFFVDSFKSLCLCLKTVFLWCVFHWIPLSLSYLGFI